MKSNTLNRIGKSVIASGLLLAATLSAVTPSQAQQASSVKEVNATSLRLRGGPSINHATITVLDKGDKLTLAGSAAKDGWVEVQLPSDAPCYIFATFVSDLGNGTGKVTGDNVNLRLASNTSNYAIGQSNEGDLVSFVLGSDGKPLKENGFYKITPPRAATGWVSEEYLTDSTSSAAPAYEAPKQGGVTLGNPQAKKVDENTPAQPASGDDEERADVPDAPLTGSNLIGEAKAFRDLDVTFLEEMSKPTAERNFTQIKRLYQQYAEVAEDAMIRAKAKERVESINRVEALIAKMLSDAQKESESEAEAINRKSAEAEAEAEAKAQAAAEAARKAAEKASSEKAAVEYIAMGTVVSHGRRATYPASHAITDKNGAVIYYVRWLSGRLENFVDRKVGLTGKIEEVDGWDRPIIVVSQCDLLESNENADTSEDK